MARRIKSLLQNDSFPEKGHPHREHRSKKGRNKRNRSTTDATYLYKRKKEALKHDIDEKSLRFGVEEDII